MKLDQRETTAYVVLCRGGVSAQRLAEALRVSLPTASRTVASLRRKGVQIASVRENGSWHYEVRNRAKLARARLRKLKRYVGFIKTWHSPKGKEEDLLIYGAD